MKFKESEKVELKASLSRLEESLKAACGFLNHKGGTIYFGIDNRGIAIGVSVTDPTIRKVSQKLHAKIKPEFNPEITEVTTAGKSVLRVEIPEGSNKPYFLDGVAYKRVGTENRIIPPDELKRLIRKQEQRRWDSETCRGLRIKDVDVETLKTFVQLVNETKKQKITETGVKSILTKLGLASGSTFTNAAVLLFGKNPQKYLPSAKIQAARFKGTSSTTFLDMKVYEGTLFAQLRSAIDFIQQHTSLTAEIQGLRRIERWEYPIEALREAVINALIHRDYLAVSHIQVRIHDDGITILNPGGLPEGMTVDKLRSEHPSIPRNPLLAETFFLAGLIEKWGTGTLRIIEKTREHGLPEPSFSDERHSFSITLGKGLLTDEVLAKLNERQRKVVQFLRHNESISNQQYQELFSVSKPTATRDLRELVRTKIVVAVGRGKRDIRYVLAQHESKMSQKMSQKGRSSKERG
jgi:ATP-dependent DNA helicase RecG